MFKAIVAKPVSPMRAVEALLALKSSLGAHSRIPPPPPKWWEDHEKRVAAQHPDYDGERLNRAVGAIWYNYKPDKREMVLLAEALSYC